MKEEGGSSALHHPVLKELPVISIIIVTYNADKYLADCLASIISQRFKNIELLLFDGASTDTTLQIIKEYDKYISYWQSEPDNGIYDAMNKAVKKATGDWILFLGADDTLLDGFSLMAEKLKSNNSIYYGYCLINNKQSNKKLSPYYIAKYNLCHQAIFYPKIVFTKYSYNHHFIVYADHALNIQCWGDTSLKKKYYAYPITKYSLEGFSNQVKDPFFVQEQLNWIKRYAGKDVYFRYLFKKWKTSKRK